MTSAVVAVLTASSARAEDAGLPQLDVSMFPEQLFWLALCFALLYVLMAYVAMPRVAETQDNRATVIAGEVAAARIASDSAKATILAVEQSLQEARAKARASVNEMIAALAKDSAEKQTMQQHELTRHLHHAEAEIIVTRQAALAAVRAEAAQLADSIMIKISGAKGRA